MKIVKIGNPRVIMGNHGEKHDYFAWPTAVRLKNGNIAIAASGFRLRHICPFGKTVLVYSSDEGECYTYPQPVFDTVLDDRDGGLCAFGESGLIVTSFNNTTAFQRGSSSMNHYCRPENRFSAYDTHYLDSITPEAEAAALGASFRISLDNGSTFGAIHKSPITSPHGPTVLSDGSLLWVGRTFSPEDVRQPEHDRIEAHKILSDGRMEFLGAIDNVTDGDGAPLCCEPYAIELEDGNILAHIRVQCKGKSPLFTLYQTKSHDGGRHWSTPRRILSPLGGAPSHLLKASDGRLICSFGFREKPYGIKVMFSCDGGEHWEDTQYLYQNTVCRDIGYPTTVELADGSFLTVFYAHQKEADSAVILQQKWRLEE